MVRVDLKGVAKVTAKGRTYWYAWRGGPRLAGQPGSPEFLASFLEAQAEHRRPDETKFRFVIAHYKANDFLRLADSTRANWLPWLDRVTDYFGELSTAQFDRPDKIRPVIRKWRNGYADKPRSADYGLQVLSRVLSYAVDPLGKIGSNPCEGIKQLYSADRAEIIWTDADLVRLKATCGPEIAHAVDLAAFSGLRLGDLLRLAWSHIGGDAIVLATGKSKGRREAIIPLYDELRGVLGRIPKRATTVLTNSRGLPWTTDGFGSSFNKAKKRAGLDEVDLHFHDLRGTAATRFYTAGHGAISERAIAEIMGWEEEHVSRIIRRYVGRSAATQAVILQLNQAKRRT